MLEHDEPGDVEHPPFGAREPHHQPRLRLHRAVDPPATIRDDDAASRAHGHVGGPAIPTPRCR